MIKEDEFRYLMNFVTDTQFNWLVSNGFFIKPAAISHHGNYTGGLYDHSKAVMTKLVDLTKTMNLKWSRPESPYIVGMFHDLCKVNDYKAKTFIGGDGIEYTDFDTWEYNKDTLFKGHGEKSVMLLSQLMTLTEEEMLCIRYHMGAYNTDDWSGFDLAIRKYENVLWTHMADMYASKVLNI